MNYETFLQTVCEEVNTTLSPEESVELQTVLKLNDTLRQALVYRGEQDYACPMIYMERYYQDYQNAQESPEVLRQIITSILQTIRKETFPYNIYEQIDSFERVKERVQYRLINRKTNQQLLKGLPHFHHLDFTVIFHIPLDLPGEHEASTLVRHSMLEQWHTTSDTILAHALHNTPLQRPAVADTIQHLIFQLLEADVPSTSEVSSPLQRLLTELCNPSIPLETLPKNIPLPKSFLVLSNATKYYGASVLFYPDILQRFATYFQTNFFVLPSSVHEVLLLGDTGTHTLAELSEMVQSINRNQVPQEERLSDHAYYYDLEEAELTYEPPTD